MLRAASPLALLALAQAAITSPISLTFVGRSWSVKTGGPLDPGANRWVPELARVDGGGALHLAIAPLSPTSCSAWGCSEVWLNEPLGYGTYIFHATFPARLDSHAVFGVRVPRPAPTRGLPCACHEPLARTRSSVRPAL